MIKENIIEEKKGFAFKEAISGLGSHKQCNIWQPYKCKLLPTPHYLTLQNTTTLVKVDFGSLGT